jgi:hypothetical protein
MTRYTYLDGKKRRTIYIVEGVVYSGVACHMKAFKHWGLLHPKQSASAKQVRKWMNL